MDRGRLENLFKNIVKTPKVNKLFTSTLLSVGLLTSLQASPTQEISVFSDIKQNIQKPINIKENQNQIQKINYEKMVINLEKKEKENQTIEIIKENYDYIVENVSNIGEKTIEIKINKKIKELKELGYEAVGDLEELIENQRKTIAPLQEVTVGNFLNIENINMYQVAKQIKSFENKPNTSDEIKQNIKKLGSVGNILKYLERTNTDIDINKVNKNTNITIDLTTLSIDKFINPNIENKIKKIQIYKKVKEKRIKKEKDIKEMFSKISHDVKKKEVQYQNNIANLFKIKNERLKKENKIITKKEKNEQIEKKYNVDNKYSYNEQQVININKKMTKKILIEKFGEEQGMDLYEVVSAMANQLYSHNELKSSFALNSILQTISIESNFNPNAKNIGKKDHSHGLTQINIQTKNYRGDILRLLKHNKSKPGVNHLYNYWKKNKNNVNNLSKILKDPKINIIVGMIIMENKLSYKRIKRINKYKQNDMETKVNFIIKKYSKGKKKLTYLNKYIKQLDNKSKKEFFNTLNAQTAYNGLDMLRNITYLTKILKVKNEQLKKNQNLIALNTKSSKVEKV